MQEKYRWTDRTITTIDWMIHGRALNNLKTSRKSTITKFIHEWLPVNGHPGRNLPELLTKCPHCKINKETQQHFLSCPETTTMWQDTIQANLPTFLRQPEHKQLLSILLWASTTNSSNNNIVPQSLLTTRHETLLVEQAAIGWNQVIKGRLSTEWVRHLDNINQHKGENHATDIITSLWHSVLTKWHGRCDLQHQQNPNQSSLITQQLQPHIIAIYLKKPELDTIDQKILDQPLETTLRLPIKVLRDWIKHSSSFV
jgi:hypothetical protein